MKSMLQASAAGRSGRLTQSFEDGIGRPTPNAINDLKRRELQRTADRISARSGLHHANPIEGEKFSGTYKQFINLASGKYAIIENAKEFVLVPWKPGLEDMKSKVVSGAAGPNRNWEIVNARQRGIGI